MVTKFLDFVHKHPKYKVVKSFFYYLDRFSRNLAETDKTSWFFEIENHEINFFPIFSVQKSLILFQIWMTGRPKSPGLLGLNKYYAKYNELTKFLFPSRALNSSKHKFSKQNAKRKKVTPFYRFFRISVWYAFYLSAIFISAEKKVTEFYHFSKLFSIKKEMSSSFTNI